MIETRFPRVERGGFPPIHGRQSAFWSFLQRAKNSKINPTQSDSTSPRLRSMRSISFLLHSAFWIVSMFGVMSMAQQSKPAAPPPASRELHADGSVTFLFPAPNAQDLKLALEGAQPAPMHRD